MMGESPAPMTDGQAGSMGSTTYYIRIGATGSPTMELSTAVVTTYTDVTFTSNSHTFSTLSPVITTEITLVPVPVQPTQSGTMVSMGSPATSSSSSKHTAVILAATVVSIILFLLLIGLAIRTLLLRRRRRRERARENQRVTSSSGSDFFPEPAFTEISSARVSYAHSDTGTTTESARTVSMLPEPVQAGDRLSVIDEEQIQDELDLGGSPVRPNSISDLGSSELPALFFRYNSMGALSAATASSALCRSHSLREQVVAVQREISVLERHASVPRDVEEGSEEGRRLEELRALVRELEREQEVLRIQIERGEEVGGEDPPPDYTSTE
ncbi:hypothetical protein FB45DRAFT_380389 [Roridomyces roridus]|uniref:Uncharacterized protein n=1 Tax=Roridomyces roridus TaxID=1738132 RepID=A0AAD7B3C9_9AGAR|nr:hypothetical protein FB45DRAFT_380389 [Roridomyces roridus]